MLTLGTQLLILPCGLPRTAPEQKDLSCHLVPSFIVDKSAWPGL